MLLTQAGNRVAVVTDLLQQSLGVLAERRHGVHPRRYPLGSPGGSSAETCPAGVSTSTQRRRALS